MLRGDLLSEKVPRRMAIARHIQGGNVPLWDFQTYAGGRPFYVDDGAHLFYPILLPFHAIADTQDEMQAVMCLVLAPYALHLLWTCVGAYLFGRLSLSLGPAGAAVSALLWTLSPDMTDSFEWLSNTYIFSHLPWILLASERLVSTGRVRWWSLGAVCLFLVGSMGAAIYAVRIYFVAAFATGLFWLFRQRRTPEGRLVRLLAAASTFVVAAGMAGFAWGPVFESVSWLDEFIVMDYGSAATYDLWSSTHPVYLATLFIPDLFGIVDSRHAWGAGYSSGLLTSSAFTGGLFVMTAVLAAVLYRVPRRPRTGKERVLAAWTRVAGVVFIVFLFAVMGRYTPVFRWMCAILPWFFRFPHAVYYRFACCWSLAVLAGIGVRELLAAPVARRAAGRWLTLVACLGPALAGIAAALLWPAGLEQGGSGSTVPGYRTLTIFGEWTWFLTGPLLYFAVASLVLVVAFAALRPPWRGRVLLAGICAEAFVLGCLFLYASLAGIQSRKPPDYVSRPDQTRYRVPSECWFVRKVKELHTVYGPLGVRWSAPSTDLNNLVWASGGFSFLGSPAKPLVPRLTRAIEAAGLRAGREPAPRPFPRRFFENMCVGVVLTANRTHRLDTVLPYAYTQNRVVPAAADEQLNRLVSSNCRDAVRVEQDLVERDPRIARAVSDPGDAGTFAALQRTNRILAVDQRNPNRTVLDVEIRTPAMLVLAECWHPGWTATLDGASVPVEQVNYLQQGVWLEPGRHTVELRFFPKSLKIGIVVSAAAWMVFLGVVLVARRRGRRHAGNRQSPPQSESQS